MGNRKFRQMAEHGLLRYPFFAFERGNPSLKETAIIYLPQTGLLTCRLYGRHTCKLYSLLAHKFDTPPYCLPMLW